MSSSGESQFALVPDAKPGGLFSVIRRCNRSRLTGSTAHTPAGKSKRGASLGSGSVQGNERLERSPAMDLQHGLGQFTCFQLLLCEKEQGALKGRQLSTRPVLPWTWQLQGSASPSPHR